MTDWSTMKHRFEDSPENVAFKLMQEIAKIEGKTIDRHRGARAATFDRQWILDTFSECLQAVRGQRAIVTNGRDDEDSAKDPEAARRPANSPIAKRRANGPFSCL